MPIQITPVQRDTYPRQTDPRSGLDKELQRVMEALQIANQGFGIAVNFKTIQNMPSSEEAQAKRDLEAQTGQVNLQTAQQTLKNMPTAEEAQGIRDITKASTEQSIATSKAQEEYTKQNTQKLIEEIKLKAREVQPGQLGKTDMGKEQSDSQLQAEGYFARMRTANDLLKSLPQRPTDNPALMRSLDISRRSSQVPVLGAGYKTIQTATGTDPYTQLTTEGKQYTALANEWIRAKIRKESGAVITPEELASEYETYFPIAGDDEHTIQLKEKLRENATDAMKINTGRFNRPSSLVERTTNPEQVKKEILDKTPSEEKPFLNKLYEHLKANGWFEPVSDQPKQTAPLPQPMAPLQPLQNKKGQGLRDFTNKKNQGLISK